MLNSNRNAAMLSKHEGTNILYFMENETDIYSVSIFGIKRYQ